jgi:uncharacterized membrane protein
MNNKKHSQNLPQKNKDLSAREVKDQISLETIRREIHQISHFSGPLPPPEEFEKYGSVLTNAPDRILTMAEFGQREHYKQNKLDSLLQFIITLIGMFFALGAILSIGYIGYKLTMNGHKEVGKVIFGYGLCLLIVSFTAPKLIRDILLKNKISKEDE